MGYLLLSVALFSGAVKGYCGKKTGSFTKNTQSAVLLNLVRMAVCILFGTAVIFAYNDTAYFTLNPRVLLISALSGVSTAVFVVSWLISVKKSAYMMLDVFLMLGTLIPMLASRFAFEESILAKQWIGFAVLVLAVVIMCSYNNSVKIKLTVRAVLLLILCGAANGLADFSQKIYVKMLPEMPVSIFNLYTYIFAAITLAVVYFVTARGEKAEFESGSRLKYVYILIMAIALFVNSYFKTSAAVYLDSAELYPLNQGLALVISTFMATAFFKERLTLKCVCGILLAFLGLLIMNVL